MEVKTTEHKTLVLSIGDVKRLLPDEKFEYKLYWNYDDRIDKKTLQECMPDEDNYKREDWTINYEDFVNDWKINIEDLIWEWNISYINEQLSEELNTLVKDKLKEKQVEYDDFEFDFCADELYTIDLWVDEILSKSPIVWNVVWHNNFDGFTEWEKAEDWEAIEQFLRLNKGFATKEQLEDACAEWIYTGSDLKINYKTSMFGFLEQIKAWGKDISWDNAVLHLSINGSGSPDFRIKGGQVEFGKKLESNYDYWDWSFDWHYWVEEVYWQPINNYF